MFCYKAIVISALDFISFTFWNYWIPEICYEKNSLLDNDFDDTTRFKIKTHFRFDIDFEKKKWRDYVLLLNACYLFSL
jgi:hypothetical protein